jgi:DNA polymerase IV
LMRQRFGSLGTHLSELAHARDPRPVIGDWRRKSYGEENTFEQDQPLDALELKRTLIAHGEALAHRLRADRVRARTVTLKLKLARPLGGGRYPMVTSRFSIDSPTDDGAAITRIALSLLAKIKHKEKIRLAGIQVHNLERRDDSQLGLFDAAPQTDAKHARLNRALDEVNKRFGEDAVSRGLVRATRAAPSSRIK